MNWLRWGYPCKGIHFGNSAINSQAFHLRTAEMYNNIKDWLQSGGCINPRDAELINQLKAREYGYNEKGQLVIESKKVMKSRCAKSPDDSDALALTLAYPHRNNNLKKQPKIHKHQSYKNPLGHDSLESFYK
ncbi:phage terminase large subunit [Bathymodiolus japonicus methanotrophic gill symbiont]|nr:phage terminase large subunit [Bathymodiolus japonicus methanotrophic gill symbiont]